MKPCAELPFLPLPARLGLTTSNILEGVRQDFLAAPFLRSLPPVVVNGKLYLAPFGRGVYFSREDGSDWLPINQGLDQPTPGQFFAAGTRLYCVTSNIGIGEPMPATRIFTRKLAAQSGVN